MFFGQKYPKSEASEKGLGIGEMFRDVGVLGALVVAYLLVLFFNGNLGIDKASSWVLGAGLVVVAGIKEEVDDHKGPPQELIQWQPDKPRPSQKNTPSTT